MTTFSVTAGMGLPKVTSLKYLNSQMRLLVPLKCLKYWLIFYGLTDLTSSKLQVLQHRFKGIINVSILSAESITNHFKYRCNNIFSVKIYDYVCLLIYASSKKLFLETKFINVCPRIAQKRHLGFF